MTSLVRLTPTARLVLRAVCLFGVLAGIVGMHGLATHGTAGDDLAPYTVVSQPDDSVAAPRAEAMTPATKDATQPVGTTAASSSTYAPGHASNMADYDDMGMAGLCLAILLVGIVALTVWLARHRPRSWALSSPRLVRLIERKGRDLSPPFLHALSIQRC